MPGECRDRMTQHAGPAEREVLLGHGAAESTASTGRNDEGIYGSHARIYRTIRNLAIARRGAPFRCDNCHHKID
jgi:hypothetical protein